jgi:hypothetical protein
MIVWEKPPARTGGFPNTRGEDSGHYRDENTMCRSSWTVSASRVSGTRTDHANMEHVGVPRLERG